MAAPVPTPRLTPTAKKLGDGFKTLITLAGNTAIEFWEETVTPPAIEGGDAIESATMHSVLWRTKTPRKLITMGDVQARVQFNPSLYTSILARVNVPDTVTITFPDHSSLAFYGYLKSFAPAELSEGAVGTGTITITPTLADPTTGAEQGPVYTPPGMPGFAPVEGGLGDTTISPVPVQSARLYGLPPEVAPDSNFSDSYSRSPTSSQTTTAQSVVTTPGAGEEAQDGTQKK
jgi:hypothetical protein